MFLLKSKDEVFAIFKKYMAKVENLTMMVNTCNIFLIPIVKNKGQFTDTPTYFPQSNIVAEQKNKTLTVMVNAMMISSGLPRSLWGKL